MSSQDNPNENNNSETELMPKYKVPTNKNKNSEEKVVPKVSPRSSTITDDKVAPYNNGNSEGRMLIKTSKN